MVAGAAWGCHEAFMHHWPAVISKYQNIPVFWNPAVTWTWEFPWWYPVQITDGKHLLFTIHGLSVAAAFWLTGREMLIVGGIKTLWPWGYVVYLGGIFAAYTAGNYLTYNLIFA